MRARTIALLTVAALGLAGCGGDDGGSGPIDRPAEVDTGLPGGAELPEGVRDLLENMDPDELAQMDDDEREEMIQGLQDSANEMISSFGGDGGGSITIGDVTYVLEPDVCIAFGTDLSIDGPAIGSDGSVAWVFIDHSISTRDEMAEFLDESMVEMIFPAGVDTVTDVNIEVNVGSTGRFDDADGPSWNATAGDWFGGTASIEYEYRDGRLTGAGTADDYSDDGFGNQAEIRFEAYCD